MIVAGALIVAAAIAWSAWLIAAALQRTRRGSPAERAIAIVQLFAPGIAACAGDPRALLVWQPLALTARKALPEEFAALDAAAGHAFPFSQEQISDAHARWTTEWLAWERAHDAEFKLKTTAAESDLTASGGAPVMRARLAAIEQEKLEQYQRRYEEYIRAARALQALIEKP
jgi:hypothetical protein